MKLAEITNKNKGTYAGYKLSAPSKKYLSDFMKENEIPNALDPDKLHVTLVYSRKHLPDFKPLGNVSIAAKPEQFVVWKGRDSTGSKEANCLILLLDCPEAEERHKQIKDEHGATFDYDKYQPHITLSYDIGDMKIARLKVPTRNIMFVEEYVEDLDLDWAVSNG